MVKAKNFKVTTRGIGSQRYQNKQSIKTKMSNSIKRKLHGKTIKFFGPPGTGKTHRLLQRAKRFLRRGVLPDEICYISFTNKAVQECLDRVRKEFKGYDEDDFKYFRTLHSLARQQFWISKQAILTFEMCQIVVSGFEAIVSFEQRSGTWSGTWFHRPGI